MTPLPVSSQRRAIVQILLRMRPAGGSGPAGGRNVPKSCGFHKECVPSRQGERLDSRRAPGQSSGNHDSPPRPMPHRLLAALTLVAALATPVAAAEVAATATYGITL